MSSPRLFRVAVALAPLAALCLCARPASAFERQWHFGGGAGVALSSDAYQNAPALSLHAAYGLSDVFDGRLELCGSRQRALAPASQSSIFYAARLGLAYKVDVIRWVPYLGPSIGFLGVTKPLSPFGSAQATLGLLGGLDFAVSRGLAVGVAGAVDYTLLHPGAYGTGLFHVEYQFGW